MKWLVVTWLKILSVCKSPGHLEEFGHVRKGMIHTHMGVALLFGFRGHQISSLVRCLFVCFNLRLLQPSSWLLSSVKYVF